MQDYTKSFDLVVAENNTLYYKLKGKPLYYNYSTFQLFHFKNKKFLSFEYDEQKIMR